MNIYEYKNAIFKLNGYFIPTRNETPGQAFDRGKAELIKALKREIENVETIDFTEFEGKRRLI